MYPGGGTSRPSFALPIRGSRARTLALLLGLGVLAYGACAGVYLMLLMGPLYSRLWFLTTPAYLVAAVGAYTVLRRNPLGVYAIGIGAALQVGLLVGANAGGRTYDWWLIAIWAAFATLAACVASASHPFGPPRFAAPPTAESPQVGPGRAAERESLLSFLRSSRRVRLRRAEWRSREEATLGSSVSFFSGALAFVGLWAAVAGLAFYLGQRIPTEGLLVLIAIITLQVGLAMMIRRDFRWILPTLAYVIAQLALSVRDVIDRSSWFGLAMWGLFAAGAILLLRYALLHPSLGAKA